MTEQRSSDGLLNEPNYEECHNCGGDGSWCTYNGDEVKCPSCKGTGLELVDAEPRDLADILNEEQP